MNEIIEKDKELLVYLNNFNSNFLDSFFLLVTNQFYLTPIFLLFFYLLWRNLGWRNLGLVLLFVSLILLVCDQSTNLCKLGFQRLRPINDLDIKNDLRIFITRHSFSFFSGHASNSMATTLFLYFIFREYYKYAFLMFLFPIVFAYSRIHLALHFPSDILVGYMFGAFVGTLFYRLYKKYNSTQKTDKNKYLLTTSISVLTYFVICKYVITPFLTA